MNRENNRFRQELIAGLFTVATEIMEDGIASATAGQSAKRSARQLARYSAQIANAAMKLHAIAAVIASLVDR